MRIIWELRLPYNKCGYSFMHLSPMLTDHDVANCQLSAKLIISWLFSQISKFINYFNHLLITQGVYFEAQIGAGSGININKYRSLQNYTSEFD